MRLSAVILWLLFTVVASAGKPVVRVQIYLLDPRILAHTETTLGTEYAGNLTDVIGSRTLSLSEAEVLIGLLKRELIQDENVPFCGHRPAYAVKVIRDDNSPFIVTLCGICGTWARDGKLRALNGKRSLEYLEQLLPLPDFLKSVHTGPDLDQLGRDPFFQMRAKPIVDQ